MREMGFEDCLKYMALVRETIPSDWLSQELQKISSYSPPKKKRRLSFIDYTEKFHPLAFLIHRADKQLKSCIEKKSFEISEEILRLSYLGENLSILKDRNTKGLDNKIRDLTSSDKALFEPTTYEIEVAAKYVEKGYPAEFLETKPDEGTKTPDILVAFKNGVEVECKKKARKSGRDTRNTEYWKLITQNASGMMDRFGSNYAVFVKTQKDPTKQDVEYILKQLQGLMKEGKEGRFVFADRGIGINLQILSGKDQQIESTGIQFGTSEELDYLVPAMEVKKEKDGKPFVKNPRICGFKSAVVPERIMRVIQSIKSAKQQLSGDRPGLIYVHLNKLDRKMVDIDFKRLDRLTKELLKANSTISGVVITTDFFAKDVHGCVYSHRARATRNEQAKHTLPSDFEIVGESGY